MKILLEDYKGIRDTLVKDYVKDKQSYFPILKDRYGIDEYTKTDKFKLIINDKRCRKILFKWCTGLEIGADDPLKLVDLPRSYNRFDKENFE